MADTPELLVDVAAKVCPVFRTLTGREPEPHTAAAAHRRLHREASTLLRELEDAADSADGITLAGRFIGIIRSHINPLRAAISDVEFYEEAERIATALTAGQDAA